MSSVRTIYLADELNEKLKTEKNISALVSNLLREHYKNSKTENLTLEQVRKRKTEIENGAGQIVVKELEALNEIEQELLKTEEEKKAEEEKKKLRGIETFKDNIRVFCDVEESEVQSLAEMFEIERINYDNFFDWCKAKRIIMKAEDIGNAKQDIQEGSKEGVQDNLQS